MITIVAVWLMDDHSKSDINDDATYARSERRRV